MKIIRKLIKRFLGIENYLKIISRTYLLLVLNGFLKKRYPELFFLKKIIKPGFYCIDIGANLGYYSTLLSGLAGKHGKIFAVEPVPLFVKIWKKNVQMSKIDNLQMLPFALGGENTSVRMGMPVRDGVVHHGMTKIVSTKKEDYIKYYDVDMKIPDELFSDLERLDFVKCDVEGYESEVFSNMTEILSKFRPLVQSELSGTENRISVINFFKRKGYSVNILDHDGNLVNVEEKIPGSVDRDLYFIPEKITT